MLHCPTSATSWSTSFNRDGIESKNWPSKQVKCSSTGRSTAIKRKQRKKPIVSLPSTAHPLFSSNVSIILLIYRRTKYLTMASNWSRAVGNAKAGSTHPSQSKSSIILPCFSTALFFPWRSVCDTLDTHLNKSCRERLVLASDAKSSSSTQWNSVRALSIPPRVNSLAKIDFYTANKSHQNTKTKSISGYRHRCRVFAVDVCYCYPFLAFMVGNISIRNGL